LRGSRSVTEIRSFRAETFFGEQSASLRASRRLTIGRNSDLFDRLGKIARAVTLEAASFKFVRAARFEKRFEAIGRKRERRRDD